MSKSKKTVIIIIILVSIALVFGISVKLLDTTGKINQGNFRVNDTVVTSTIDVEEQVTATEKEVKNTEQTAATEAKTEEKAENLNKLTFKLSQKNTIALLITKDVEIKEMYLDNYNVTTPSKKGVIKTNINGVVTDLQTPKTILVPTEKDGQYYLEIKIDNTEFATDVKIPEGTNAVTFDGTILKLLDIKLSDIAFVAKFNLNIIDVTGKKNVCEFKFKLPNETLLTDGISITREENSNYVFSLRENKN